MNGETPSVPMVLLTALLAVSDAAAQSVPPAPPLPAKTTAAVDRPSRPRLSSELMQWSDIYLARGESAARRFAAEHDLPLAGPFARVVIEARPESVEAVERQVEANGGRTERVGGDRVVAHVPLEALRRLGLREEVLVIRRPERPVLFETSSQGVGVIGAQPWQQSGRRGSGVKIGILDVGFSGYASLMGTELPDIPPSHVRSFGGDIGGNGERHGTAVAEIVHDVAPDSQLYLANASDEENLEDAVDWLIEQRVDVINAAWGYPCSGSLDGTGRVNELVARAAAAGILWVNAAGNFARRHWSGVFTDTNADGWHNFTAGDNGNLVPMKAGDELRVCLSWDDWTERNQDYDLYVWNSSGTVVARSDDEQSGRAQDRPKESLSFTASVEGDYYIGLRDAGTTRNARLHLNAYPPGAECAIESVADAESKSSGLLSELREVRDRVLRRSPFGRELIRFYERRSPEAARALLLHPQIGAEAALLLRAARPAVRAFLGGRRGDRSDDVVVSIDLMSRIEHFLDRLETVTSPTFRAELSGIRDRMSRSRAVGQPVDVYWESLHPEVPLSGVRTLSTTEPTYMTYTTAEQSLVPPADSPHALTVGAALWSSRAVEDFSSQGPTTDGRTKPDLVAPDGVCTVTYADCTGDGFLGTSASTAHVTGAYALLKEAYPSETVAGLQARLSGSALDLAPAGLDNRSGAGLLTMPAPPSAPVIRAVIPSVGVTGGGTVVQVKGIDFGTGAKVWFGGMAATVKGTTSTTILAATPAHSAGSVEVVVQNANGSSGRLATGYEYRDAPAVETAPARNDLGEDPAAWPSAARNAVVITHGWLFPVPGADPSAPWIHETAAAVCDRLGAASMDGQASPSSVPFRLAKVCQARDTDVWTLEWFAKAGTLTPWSAWTNGKDLGENLAAVLRKKNYAHIHFIGHSAGSNVIDSATASLRTWIAEERRPGVAIHETFLDAYHPDSDASVYGASADWADNYVDTRDVGDLFLAFDGTKLFLDHGYTVDVTPLGDPCNTLVPNYFAVWPCRHSRPYRFYGVSIDSSFRGDSAAASADPIGGGTALMGFPLSREAGASLGDLKTRYPSGAVCTVNGSECSATRRPNQLWTYLPRVIVRKSITVAVGSVAYTWGAGDVFLQSIRLGAGLLTPASTAADSVVSGAVSSSASWIVIEADTDEPVNTMSFGWRFSPGGEGYLRVFVDDVLIREIDRRHVPSTVFVTERAYVGGDARVLAPGLHRIAFRLDGFSGGEGVELREVSLGINEGPAGRRRSVRH